jgi:trehalose synthase
MIHHYKKHGPWIWRCHIDLSEPNGELWDYLSPVVEKYDAVILSIEEYKRKIETPQLFFMPAINPFSIKNKQLSDEEMEERLNYYDIPTDLPLVVQISRFDRWKDPEGVIEAFKLARKEIDATLVLLGNIAVDDPEGPKVYDSLMAARDERIIILSKEDTALVNTLQRRAAVVLQKSIREGFGLTVAEAMWKGTPVIGGNVGGIWYQIEDGSDGFLVSSIQEAADRIVQLIQNEALRRDLGRKAHQKVKNHFLLTRLLEQYLDLFNSFETVYCLKTQ